MNSSKIYRTFLTFDDAYYKSEEQNRITFFLSVMMTIVILSISINAQSWLPDYNYRRALTVTNSGSALTDYQVLIQLTSFNFNNHFPLANGEDIRITASDGTTLLPLWIESWSSNQGVIWTKVPSVPAGTSTIYIYYGNSLASSISNGNSTFSLFEDNWLINPFQAHSQSWEESISYPVVFKEQDSTKYYMIYDGHGFYDAKGLATSPNLINWTPYANNPIIGYNESHVDHGGAGQYAWGDVIKVGSIYYMYPSKGPGTTYRAQSNDLINWTGFTVLTTNDLDGIGVGAAILKEGDGITPVVLDGKYWMVYNHASSPGDIYMAYSTDLKYWNKANNGNPVVLGDVWDKYSFSQSFVKIGSTYYIYYNGRASALDNYSIGFASALDTDIPGSATWTKSANNPVIMGNHGWDQSSSHSNVQGPALRYFDGTYYLFYTGENGDLGFATSTSPEGPWTQSTTWLKKGTGGISQITNGIINIASAQNIQTQLNYTTNNALGFRAYVHNDYTGYKWGGFIAGEDPPNLTIQVDGDEYFKFISADLPGQVTEDIGSSYLSAYHNFEITWRNTAGRLYIDHSLDTSITTHVPSVPLPINFENLNNANNTLDVDWVYLRKYSNPDPTVTTVGAEESMLYVDLKVLLQGPYSGSGQMSPSLNGYGALPLSQPYSGSPWSYAGSESVGSIPVNVVDWVLVELRSATTTVSDRRAAFIKNDGTLVDLDGVSKIKFSNAGSGDYYAVIYHRNHLSVMTTNKVTLTYSPAPYDMRTDISKAYGTNAMKDLGGGYFGMYSGDANGDGTINATDLNTYWIPENGTTYDYQTKPADFNLDATINATDLNTYWIPNNGKATQVPVPLF